MDELVKRKQNVLQGEANSLQDSPDGPESSLIVGASAVETSMLVEGRDETAHDLQSISHRIRDVMTVHKSTLVTVVADFFYEAPHSDAVAIVDDDGIVGLITRFKLSERLFSRFGFALYGKRDIFQIADHQPVIVRDTDQLDHVLLRALERPHSSIYDDVIVVDEKERYRGLVSVKEMVLQQSEMLALSIAEREIARLEARKLAEIGKIKTNFLSNVTHELRSPVNTMIGLAELLFGATQRGQYQKIEQYVTTLRTCGTNLRALVNNVLDMAKIEAGKLDRIIEEFSLSELIDDVAEVVRVLVHGKPIEVKTHEPDHPVMMSSDPIKVRQILMNLVNNAAKFTERGTISISVTVNSEHIRISVSDTGIGIHVKDQSRIFETFSQVENAKIKRFEGSGLGLSITGHLVSLLQGNLELRSEFGMGSTFTIVFPHHFTREIEDE